jgi:hypothetical protein
MTIGEEKDERLVIKKKVDLKGFERRGVGDNYDKL